MMGVLAVVASLAFGVQAAPQAPQPTVDQVIDKYIAAAGGRAALEKLTSRVSTGTLEIPDIGITGAIQLMEKAPNRNLATVQLGEMGSMREGTDGKIAWADDPQSGLREKVGDEAAQAMRNAMFNQELHLKTIFPKMTVTGREQVAGRPAIAVTGSPADGVTARLYFDAETGLLVRRSETQFTPQGPMDVDAFFEDYRLVDGVRQPFLIRQVTPMFTALIRITEMKHNVALDDAIFRKPS
jgi:hypothetical protein